MVKQCLTTVGHSVGVAILAVLTAAILAGPTLLFAAICGFGTWLIGCDTVIVVVFAIRGAICGIYYTRQHNEDYARAEAADSAMRTSVDRFDCVNMYQVR